MDRPKQKGEASAVVPLFGRDEMNLVEFPFGPITATTAKTLEVEHPVFDRSLKREVMRRMIITGSDAFGLPRPIDDQVLVGLKALTHEAGYTSRKVEFSRYHLCRVIGWKPDGRAYQRLETSFDRIAGTTLKFRDAWWDKGEREWKSKTFHLIEESDLCSRDRMQRTRAVTGKAELRLCYFVWNEVIWKSFQDGFIKKLDMEMFRRIAQGRRRDVPLRLFRILDKRLHRRNTARLDLHKLCVGTLGLSPSYSPSQMARVLDRAVKWLIECEYIKDYRYEIAGSQRPCVVFYRQTKGQCRRTGLSNSVTSKGANKTGASQLDRPRSRRDNWLWQQSETQLFAWEAEALEAGFGSELERGLVRDKRSAKLPILGSGRIREDYLRKYLEQSGLGPASISGKCPNKKTA